ncbi:MAG: cell division protein ZapA [Myxococcales bacterium]|nr:cell division protein ZapA [Myxococcales bacterium]
MSRSVRVSIAGSQFSVRTDAKPKYVRDLASYVEEKMAETKAAAVA